MKRVVADSNTTLVEEQSARIVYRLGSDVESWGLIVELDGVWTIVGPNGSEQRNSITCEGKIDE